jgi:hypothetical protein
VSNDVARLLDERVFRGRLGRVLDERRLRQGARVVVEREGIPPARELDVRPLEILRTADLDALRDPGGSSARSCRRSASTTRSSTSSRASCTRTAARGCGTGSIRTSSARTSRRCRGSRSPRTSRSASATAGRSSSRSSTCPDSRRSGRRSRWTSWTRRGCGASWRSGRGCGWCSPTASSRSSRASSGARGPIDLALVDAAHHEWTAQHDLDSVRPHANIVVLHDIVSQACPGVEAVWNRFRDEHAADWEFAEFTDQYDDVLERQGGPYLGIGVAVRRRRLAVH